MSDEITVETAIAVIKSYVGGAGLCDVTRLGQGRQWTTFLVERTGYWAREMEPLPWRWVLRLGNVTPETYRQWHDGVWRGSSAYIDSLLNKRYAATAWRYVEGVTVKEASVSGASYLPSLAATLRAVHWTRVDPAAPFVSRDWYTEIVRQARDAHDYLEANGFMNLVSDTGYCPTSYLKDYGPIPASLLHGDLSKTNTILDKDDHTKVAGLIDWDTAQYGDYMWDIAGWCAFNDEEEEAAPGLFKRLIRTYHQMGDDEPISLSLHLRFTDFFIAHSIIRMADLHRRGYRDLARAARRLQYGGLHLGD